MKKVLLKEDIPHRTTDTGTWIEAGVYRLLRELETGKLLIVVKQDTTGRLLTVVDKDEVEVI